MLDGTILRSAIVFIFCATERKNFRVFGAEGVRRSELISISKITRLY